MLDTYYAQTIAQRDISLAKDVSVYGKGYELVYANEDAQPKSAVVSPQSMFVVRDNTVEQNKLFAVHYYPQYALDKKVGRL